MRTQVSIFLFSAVVIFILAFSALLVFNPELYDRVSREDHIIEYSSSIFMFLSSFVFLRAFLYSRKLHSGNGKWLSLVLIGVSALFFLAAGEEISWGQRIFNLSTPEYLASINDQNELNFHNINKKFFDRVLDRVTIIFVIIASVLFMCQKREIAGIRQADIFIICSFAITPFYVQTSKLDFYHLLYLPLIALLVYAGWKKLKGPLAALIITLILSFAIQILHTRYHHLFPSHNNSANEFREFLFCCCCLAYSYVIMQHIKTGAATS